MSETTAMNLLETLVVAIATYVLIGLPICWLAGRVLNRVARRYPVKED